MIHRLLISSLWVAFQPLQSHVATSYSTKCFSNWPVRYKKNCFLITLDIPNFSISVTGGTHATPQCSVRSNNECEFSITVKLEIDLKVFTKIFKSITMAVLCLNSLLVNCHPYYYKQDVKSYWFLTCCEYTCRARETRMKRCNITALWWYDIMEWVIAYKLKNREYLSQMTHF